MSDIGIHPRYRAGEIPCYPGHAEPCRCWLCGGEGMTYLTLCQRGGCTHWLGEHGAERGPGLARDGNGPCHGLGRDAERSFMIPGTRCDCPGFLAEKENKQ